MLRRVQAAEFVIGACRLHELFDDSIPVTAPEAGQIGRVDLYPQAGGPVVIVALQNLALFIEPSQRRPIGQWHYEGDRAVGLGQAFGDQGEQVINAISGHRGDRDGAGR